MDESSGYVRPSSIGFGISKIPIMTRGLGRLGVAVAMTGMLGAAVGGCTTNGRGNRTDDRAVTASAAPSVPPSGVCYASSVTDDARRIDTTLTPPEPCTRPHAMETFHVGQFPADVTGLPKPGDAQYRAPFEDCERKATDFLGGNWYDGRLYLTVTLPSSEQWDDGGRWYRCELVETKTLNGLHVAQRETSLSGALREAAPLAQRCAVLDTLSGGGYGQNPADCAQAHDTEYAGSFMAADAPFPTEQQRGALFDNCRDTVAGFTGGTSHGIKVDYLAWLANYADWTRGNRWVRCYAWAGKNKKMAGTVKGIGNAAPRR
jgi:hypothetical protein